MQSRPRPELVEGRRRAPSVLRPSGQARGQASSARGSWAWVDETASSPVRVNTLGSTASLGRRGCGGGGEAAAEAVLDGVGQQVGEAAVGEVVGVEVVGRQQLVG